MRYPTNIIIQIAAFNAYVDTVDLAGTNPSSEDFEAAIELVINTKVNEGTFLPHLAREIRNLQDVAGLTSWKRPVSAGCSEVTIFGSTPTANHVFYITLALRSSKTEDFYFWRIHWNDGRLARNNVIDISKIEYPTLEQAIAGAVVIMESDGKYLPKAA